MKEASVALVNGVKKKKIDWTKRKQMLDNLLNKHRAKGKKYDCITTVSGGKMGHMLVTTLNTNIIWIL